MPYSPEQLEKIAAKYAELSVNSLLAEAKKKEKKKLDPKAKVRNRGTVCVPAERAKDKKDHFPINDEGQARNALARVHQYSSAPSWYSGSLKGLQSLVSGKVHSKYPGIGKSEKSSKKSSLDDFEREFAKYAQTMMTLQQVPASVQAQVQTLIQRLQYLAVNPDASVKQRAASYVNTFQGHMMGRTDGQFNADFMIAEANKAAALFKEIGENNAAGIAQQVAAGIQAAATGQPPASENQGTGTRAPAQQQRPARKAVTQTEGLDSKAIQQELFNFLGSSANLGNTGPDRNGVDGDWGQRSEAALQAFYKSKGISPQVPTKTVKQYLIDGAAGPVPQPPGGDHIVRQFPEDNGAAPPATTPKAPAWDPGF